MATLETKTGPQHDIIYIDRRLKKGVYWYVVHDPYSSESRTIFPPNHPAAAIHLKCGTIRWAIPEIRATNAYAVPFGLKRMVDTWVATWFQYDRLPLNCIDTQYWARRLCLANRFLFQESKKRWEVDRAADPIKSADRSYPVYIIRTYYPDFSPKEWHFTEPSAAETDKVVTDLTLL